MIILNAERIDRWLLCQLEVLNCKEVPWPNSYIRDKYGIEDCEWPVKNTAYECTVNLLTGRTHQVSFMIFYIIVYALCILSIILLMSALLILTGRIHQVSFMLFYIIVYALCILSMFK